MFWNLAAVFAGTFLGAVVNSVLVELHNLVRPMPAGMDVSDTAAMEAYVASLPTSSLLWVVVAHQMHALVGGLVAARIGESPRGAALGVGFVTLGFGLLNLLWIPHPVWMWGELPLYPAFAWLGCRLSDRLPSFEDGGPGYSV